MFSMDRISFEIHAFLKVNNLWRCQKSETMYQIALDLNFARSNIPNHNNFSPSLNLLHATVVYSQKSDGSLLPFRVFIRDPSNTTPFCRKHKIGLILFSWVLTNQEAKMKQTLKKLLKVLNIDFMILLSFINCHSIMLTAPEHPMLQWLLKIISLELSNSKIFAFKKFSFWLFIQILL